MAITNFTAAEMHGQGVVGPTLTQTVQLTFTNSSTTNGQYSAGYLILQANPTADTQIPQASNIGEKYFFVGDDGEWSTKAAIANNMTNTIAIPVRKAENDGSAVTQGILYRKVIDTNGNYLMSKGSGKPWPTRYDLLLPANALGLEVIGYDPSISYDRFAGTRQMNWNPDPASTELICTDPFGNVVGPPFGRDANFCVDFDNNGFIEKIYVEEFEKDIPIALGLTIMCNGPNAESKYHNLGVKFSDSRCLMDEVGTTTDVYRVISTGNFALKMEDV